MDYTMDNWEKKIGNGGVGDMLAPECGGDDHP
jgi:hypothetical protein